MEAEEEETEEETEEEQEEGMEEDLRKTTWRPPTRMTVRENAADQRSIIPTTDSRRAVCFGTWGEEVVEGVEGVEEE